jgi:hypothetical protein
LPIQAYDLSLQTCPKEYRQQSDSQVVVGMAVAVAVEADEGQVEEKDHRR